MAIDALAKPSPDERAAFVAQACGEDQGLRRGVEALLVAHERKGGLLESPLPGIDTGAGDPAVTQATSAAQGSFTVGPYKLLEKIGEGGMGVVYMAEQTHPVRRRVAVKIIKPGMDTRQVIARFEAERQALAMMDHPNIARVLDAGTTDVGRPYFVMELVRGVPITEYCDQQKLNPRERLELFVQVCQAVQHAHTKGIIHRDLKPTNVLVTLADGHVAPKVIDFGIAKATAGQRLTDRTLCTEFHQLVGTPLYMSPEQAEMSAVMDVDTRSDVYSLGVLLYELLTGTTPFDKERLAKAALEEVRRIIREEDPPRPSTRLSTLGATLTAVSASRHSDPRRLGQLVRGELDWIAMKALEKDRVRRYGTPSDLARDIERYLADEPVEAFPPGRVYRLRKYFRRHRAGVSTATLVAAVLLLGAVISTWQAVRARRSAAAAAFARDTEAIERLRANLGEESARQTAYASDISLAQQALAENNLGRALGLLNRNRPRDPGRDLRGWEWRYLWRGSRSDALFKLCQGGSEISSLTVSYDGALIAVGERSGGLSIWDFAKRRAIGSPPTPGGMVRVAFSPRESLLAFTSARRGLARGPEYVVDLWDLKTARVVAELPLKGKCEGLFFTSDGSTLITCTAGSESELARWRVPDGKKLWSCPAQSFNPVRGGTACAVTHDAGLAAYGMPGGRVRLVDLTTGLERWTTKVADEDVETLSFSPNGKVLATTGGYVESTIRLWDVASGATMGRLDGHRACVYSLAFSTDGQTLVSGSADQTITVWDVAGMKPLRTLRGHESEVWRIAMLPDNKTLLSGCKDGSVFVWDITTSKAERMPLVVPARLVAWKFSLDGRSIVSYDGGGRISQWDGPGFQTPKTVMDIDPGVSDVGFVGNHWLAGMRNGLLEVWDLDRHVLIEELTGRLSPGGNYGCWANGDRLVVSYGDNSLHEWDGTSRREVRIRHDVPTLSRSELSPNTYRFLSIASTGQLILSETNGRVTRGDLDLRQVSDVTFSPDGTRFATSSDLGYAKLWEAATFKEEASLGGFILGVHSVAFSPDGRRLATGSNGKQAIKVWDVDSGQELLTLESQSSLFFFTAFSRDGNILGSMTMKGRLHLWVAPSWRDIETAEQPTARSEPLAVPY